MEAEKLGRHRQAARHLRRDTTAWGMRPLDHELTVHTGCPSMERAAGPRMALGVWDLGHAWQALLSARARGFALSSYLLALWLQNAWGRGTIARRAEHCRARSGMPTSQQASWRRSREPGETSPARSGAGCPPSHPWGRSLRPSLACSLLPLPCPARPSSLHQPLGELQAPGPVPDLQTREPLPTLPPGLRLQVVSGGVQATASPPTPTADIAKPPGRTSGCSEHSLQDLNMSGEQACTHGRHQPQ